MAFVAEDAALRQCVCVWRESGLIEGARTGGPAPGGGTFASFGSGVTTISINNLGLVAFQASVTGGATGGVFLAGLGAVRSIAREGQTVAGVGRLGFPSSPSLTEHGEVVFRAALSGEAVTPSAVLLWSERRIEVVAGAALATGIGAVSGFEAPILAGPDSFMFTARLPNVGNGFDSFHRQATGHGRGARPRRRWRSRFIRFFTR